MSETVLPSYKCIRCGHVWVPRKAGRPNQCPNLRCHTTYWDAARPGAGPSPQAPSVIAESEGPVPE